MPVPDFQTFMLPVLKLFDGGAQNVTECLPLFKSDSRHCAIKLLATHKPKQKKSNSAQKIEGLMLNKFMNSIVNFELRIGNVFRRTLLLRNIVKFQKFALLTVLVSLPVPALSENFCIKGLLQKREISEAIQFFIKDFDNVVFETESNCDVSKSCSYKIMLIDFESNNIIRSDIVFSDLCNLFVQSEENIKNSDYGSDPSRFGMYEEIKLISYRIENSFGFLGLNI